MESEHLPVALLSIFVALLSCGQTTGENARTFAFSGSYAEYPRWILTRKGLASFDFRASGERGLLLYLDSSGNSGHYLALWLQGGGITAWVEVGGEAPLEATFGNHLNDLALHSVSIIHSNRTFQFLLDGTELASLQYSLGLTFDTQSGVYLGGLPASYDPDLSSVRQTGTLAGCLQNVKFANNSFSPNDLQLRLPMEENELHVGCVDQCASDQTACNGGQCVTSWSLPRGYFCDCSSADGAGEDCTEAFSEHQLHFTGDAYQCYNLTYEPFSVHDNITVRLHSPVPSYGMILTGRSQNWSDSFILFLADNQLHYHINIANETYTAQTSLRFSASENYQVQLVSAAEETSVSVQKVLEGRNVQNLETQVLHRNTNQAKPVFPHLCLGGGSLEVPIYSGAMERVFYGHFSLTEHRNFSYHDRRWIQRSDVISVSGSPVDPPLVFEWLGLAAERIAFEFRIKKDRGGAGVLLRSDNTTDSFTVFVLPGVRSEILIFSRGSVSCNGMFVRDGDWHLFVVERVGDQVGMELRITVDNDAATACTISPPRLVWDLDTLAATSRLEVAPTTATVWAGNATPFVGCFQNFQFSISNRTVRPNLEVLSDRFDRFSSIGCTYCTGPEGEDSHCPNGSHCVAEGALLGEVCSCPQGSQFTGVHCQELITPSPSSTPSPSTIPTPLPTDRSVTSSPSRPSPPSPPSPSESNTSPTTAGGSRKQNDVDYNALGQWVGVAMVTIIVLIMLGVLAVFIVCLVRSRHVKGQGFYKTEESSSNSTLPHYSGPVNTTHSHTPSPGHNRAMTLPHYSGPVNTTHSHTPGPGHNRAMTLPHYSGPVNTTHSHTPGPGHNRAVAISNGHTAHLDSKGYLNGDKKFYV